MKHLKVKRDGTIYDTIKRRAIPVRSDGRGYMCCTIDGKTHKVHKIVCILRHGPKPSPRHVPMHKDNDKLNNRPSNVRWGTISENLKHAHESGAMKANRKRKIRMHIPWCIKGDRWIWAKAEIFDSVSQAAKRFNLSPGTIASAASGKSKTAAGYRWEYI